MGSYNQALNRFKDLIKNSSMKYTKQREIILESLYKSSSHLTPEELYLKIKEYYPNLNIGIATVYRTLNFLEENHLATSISFGVQGKKYEFGEKKHHDHIICIKCGAIVEFLDEFIEKRQIEIAKARGYEMIEHSMQIFGICPKCQKLKRKD